MNLPKDTAILLSVVNMKLRDSYSSLGAFCEDNELSEEELCRTLEAAGYKYNAEKNRFE